MGSGVLRGWFVVLVLAAAWDPVPLQAVDPEREAGSALIQSFGVRDYHAHSEVWAAAQDARGVLYFGNDGVVLEYDGVAWRKLTVPDTTFVRGVAFDPASDAVFVGAVGQLGFLRLDPDGGRTFVSLLDKLPAAERDFRDIRQVHVMAGGDVFFVAAGQVMRWRAGGFTVWHPGRQDTLHSFVVDGQLYLHSRDLGLRRLEGDEFAPVAAGAEFLKTDDVPVLLSAAAAGELLAGTAGGQLWKLTADGHSARWPTGADPFLQAHGLREGRRLPDGTLALATGDAGLLTLGADGRFLGHLDQAAGLPRDQILGLFVDRENGLWAGLSFGVARVELSNTISVFNERNGLPRTVTNDLVRVDGSLFLATDSGLFRLDPAEPGAAARPAHWEKVGDGELWAACADGTGGVIIGTVDSVYQRHPDGRTERLLGPDVQPRSLVPSHRDPTRLWIPMKHGLRSLRRGPAGWRDEGMVPNLDEEIRTVAETAEGAVWVSTPTRGVFRLRFAPTPDGARGEATIQRYYKTNGLPENMGWTRSLPWHGWTDAIFASRAGLFRYNPTTDHFSRVEEYGARFGDGTFRIDGLVEDAAQDLWMYGRSTAGVWLNLELGRAAAGLPWEPMPSRITDQLGEIQDILPEVGPDGAGAVWLYGTDGVVRVLVGPRGHLLTARGGAGFGTHLRRVFTTNRTPTALPLGGGAPLSAARNNVRFEFAAATFRYGSDVRYQTRLDGAPHAGWTTTSAQTSADYTNLPAGNYTFRVRGVNRDGVLGREASYTFRVLPPWSRTPWALAGYVLVGALAIFGTVQWRSRRLRGVNAALEARVARQTDALVRARDAAESSNRAKSAFLANMSHELRTPLNAVLGYTQIILKDPALAERNRERLSVVARSGEHLLGMINEVLDLSKIEAGKLKPERADFALARLLDAAADTFRPRAADKNLGFDFCCEPGLPANVHGDEGKLRQVLFNLLGNAVKFTARGTVELRVGRAAGQAIRFEVRDTGIGIAGDQLESIFLAFHQAPNSGAALAAQGTGLGLAISQRLVAMLDGDLRVDSTLGEGSRFWFELPLPEATEPLPETASFGPKTGEVVTGYQGPHRCLLVVDDDATNRLVLREFLLPLGFLLEELAGGEECVERCTRSPRPDAVLLDLRMGGIDGFETARLLRGQPGAVGLRIIAVSASVFESDRQQALDAGCDDFLPKPFAEQALLAALGKALGLDWVTVTPCPTTMASPVDPREALVLPMAEVDGLLELSRRGDVLRIRRQLASLRTEEPRHAPFLEPLERLAANYQMNRLRDALLELQQRGRVGGAPVQETPATADRIEADAAV